MSAVYEERSRELGTTGAWTGKFAATVATVTGKATVTIDAFTDTLTWGPCPFQPRVQPQTINVAEGAEAAHNITVAQVVLPQKGDPCLVQFDENGDPWVVCWEPA